MEKLSLQEQYARKSICFGCGPANAQGLRLRSFPVEGGAPSEIACKVVWKPQVFHHAFPGILNGGIIGAVLDCHMNWTACYGLMQAQGLAQPPCTVTADFTVKLLRPTPVDAEIECVARVKRIEGDRAWIEATLFSKAPGVVKPCASGEGLFVAVKEGHPAYHRW